MTDLRTAAQQALDDLRDLHANHNITYAGTISRLEAALAQQQAEQAWVCPDSAEHRYAKPGHCEDCGKTLVQEQGCEHCNHPLYAATKCRVCGRVTEQAEPVEPVAWSGYDLDGMVEAFSRVIEARYQRANPFQNPIDMDAQMALRILRGFIPAMKAYTAPPQRKPLTQEQLYALYDEHATHQEEGPAMSGWFDFARAIERAHGIVGQSEDENPSFG